MSNRLDVDAQLANEFPTIQLTLDGTDYDVARIPAHLIEELEGAGPGRMKDILAKILDVKPKTLDNVDIRKLILTSKHIMQTVSQQLEAFVAKNVPKEGAASAPSSQQPSLGDGTTTS